MFDEEHKRRAILEAITMLSLMASVIGPARQARRPAPRRRSIVAKTKFEAAGPSIVQRNHSSVGVVSAS